ncbi:MAG: biotin--[acetyl-CoA-carboxylase] ligase [Alphaproteobacteria bacterium]|nr:MAG: biotin--[acetyl-CoA-carboxylase] ligase [Alphaproteobacteria bacterium]
MAEAGAPEGVIVWSKRQEQGVGRRGRDWASPEGNLYCSLLLRPDCSPAEGATLSFLIAVALHKAIEPFLKLGTDIHLKWPNDILINGRKTAGILLESKTGPTGRLDYVIVGTGINIATYPEVTDGLPAISLKSVGAAVKVEQLLSAYGYSFLESYMTWKEQGFAGIRADWLSRATGLGGRITVRLSNATLEGIFTGLDERGALILTLDNGEQKMITAGEVFINTRATNP